MSIITLYMALIHNPVAHKLGGWCQGCVAGHADWAGERGNSWERHHGFILKCSCFDNTILIVSNSDIVKKSKQPTIVNKEAVM